MPDHAYHSAPLEPIQLGIGRLFDRVRDAVVVADAATGRIVLWNHGAETLFGYTRDEALGLLIEDLVPPGLKTQHRLGIERYAREGTGRLIDSSVLLEFPAIRKDGSELLVEFTLSPIETTDPPGRFALAIVRDVTAKREFDAQRSSFLAMVAHDVRSPMAAVVGFAEMLAEMWDTVGEQQRLDALNAIRRSAEKVVRLAEDILLAETLGGAGLPLVVESVRLADAIADAHAPLGSPRGITFTSTVDPALVVRADEHRLWQVLTNVLTNAVRFSPAGATIDISASREGEAVAITIRDQGPGIPTDQRERVFERFAQVGDPSVKRGGVGLGLYISRQLVERMGGTIAVADVTGPGAAFVIRLPAA